MTDPGSPHFDCAWPPCWHTLLFLLPFLLLLLQVLQLLLLLFMLLQLQLLLLKQQLLLLPLLQLLLLQQLLLLLLLLMLLLLLLRGPAPTPNPTPHHPRTNPPTAGRTHAIPGSRTTTHACRSSCNSNPQAEIRSRAGKGRGRQTRG